MFYNYLRSMCKKYEIRDDKNLKKIKERLTYGLHWIIILSKILILKIKNITQFNLFPICLQQALIRADSIVTAHVNGKIYAEEIAEKKKILPANQKTEREVLQSLYFEHEWNFFSRRITWMRLLRKSHKSLSWAAAL